MGRHTDAVHAFTKLALTVTQGTPLSLAAAIGHTEMVRWLLWPTVEWHQHSEGVQRDLGGCNALELARRCQHVDMVRVLIQAGAHTHGGGFV